MRWLVLACLFLGCATTPPPPPPGPPPGPAALPAAPAAAPEASPGRDPSQPPPEVEAGCLPNCAMIHGKCQALVDPGPAFDKEQEPTDEITPGEKREELVKPCAPHCCRGQVD